MKRLEYAGYKPHRAGRIHLFCPVCKRKLSNMPRYEHDPANAVLAHALCPKCAEGMKGDSAVYLDAQGRHLDWETGRPVGR